MINHCLWCAVEIYEDVLCSVCGPIARGPSYKCGNPQHLPTLYGTGEPTCADCAAERTAINARRKEAERLRDCAALLVRARREPSTGSDDYNRTIRGIERGIVAKLSQEVVRLGGHAFSVETLRPATETAYDYHMRGLAALGRI